MKVRGIVSLMVVFFVCAVLATGMSCGGESDSGDDETRIVSTDCDADGLTDYDEINKYGTDPCDKDTDGDNLPDGLEVEKGTDPLVFNVGEPKAEPVKEISSSDNHSTIAWTGSEYGIAWWDERDGNKEIYFTTMDRYGQKTAGDIRITNTSQNSVKPSLTWSGENFGLAWRQQAANQEIYFVLLDYQGNEISAETRISYGDHASSDAVISWIGSMFCLAWQDQRDTASRDIYYASLDESGNIITSDTEIISSGDESREPSIAWSGNELGMVWKEDLSGNSEIFFTRLGPFGNKKSGNTRITYDSNASTMPHIAFNGNDYGLLWHDTRDGSRELYFKRLDIDGTALSNDIRLTTTSGDPKGFMLWTGEVYGVIWADNSSGSGVIRFTRLNKDGEKLENHHQITPDNESCWLGTNVNGLPFAWNGHDYAAVWHKGDQIYLSQFPDEDGDGLTNWVELNETNTDPYDPADK